MKTNVSLCKRLLRSFAVSAVAIATFPSMVKPAHADEITAATAPTCKEVLADWGLITVGQDGSITENIDLAGTYNVSTIDQLYCIGAGSFTVDTQTNTITNSGIDCRNLQPTGSAVLIELMHAKYVQTQNLDFNDLTVDGVTKWRPISNNGCQFMGEYDGNNKKISNIYFNEPTLTSDNRPYEGLGLFGSAGNNNNNPATSTRTSAVIKNVILEDAFIIGYQDVGGIVGIADANTLISNVSVSGTIGVSQLGYGDLGGIVGWANGEAGKRVIISNSHTDVTFEVIAPESSSTNIPWCTGGIMGYANDAEIHDSNSSITMTNEVMSGIAGLAGCLYIGAIERSFATGTIDNRNQTPSVEDAGGIVSSVLDASITDSYSLVSSASDTNVGGIANWAKNTTITRSYAATSLTAPNAATIGGVIATWWIPENEVGRPNTVTASFWDTQVSGAATTSENLGTGKTTAEMKTLATFVDSGWDIVEGTNDTKVWGISPRLNGGYPFLQALSDQYTEQNPVEQNPVEQTPADNQNSNAPSGSSLAPTIQQQFGSRELMRSITPEVFAQIAPEQLATLPISSIRGITTEAVAGMTLAQLRALTPTQIRVMRPSVLATLPAEWLSKLSTKQVKYLLPRQIRVLSEQQLQKFTSKQRSMIASVLRKATKQSNR